jgi:cell division topological specificity factor
MFLDWFKKKKSAVVARDRLSIAIMSDRNGKNIYPFMEDMKEEIVLVVRKYIGVRGVEVHKEIDGDFEAISIDVLLDKNL